MTYSKTGLAMTAHFEGCRFSSYRDASGVFTIGFGHTRGVAEGLSCIQAQADAWLVEDSEAAQRAVNRLVEGALTQDEYDALVDFVFNVGESAFAGSSMLKLLNSGDYWGASEEFARWQYVDGKAVAGLLRRRVAEASEFRSKNI